MRRRIVEIARGIPLAAALSAAAVLALALFLAIRVSAFGVTAYVFDASDGFDVTTIAQDDPIPDRVVGSFVSPLADASANWAYGHAIDLWALVGKRTDEVPPANVVYRGRIRIPGGNHWKLIASGSAPMNLWIDGEPFPAEGRHLASGWHDLQLSYRYPGLSSLELRYERGTRAKGVVPSRWLLPDSGVPTLAWVFLAVAIGCAGAVAYLARAPSARRPMVAGFREWGPVLCVALALIAGTTLRAHGRLAVPKVGDTWDEYQEAWQGLSLVQGKTPKAWGFPPWMQAYRGARIEQRKFFGREFILVDPYLDHPPLFAMCVGLSARLSGVTDLYRVPLSAIRRVPLLFTLFFYPLLYAVVRRVFGRWAAALAVVLFAVGPPFVLITRFAKGDLLVALLSLVAIWAGLLYRESKDRRFLWAMGAACGLAPWAKEIGIYAIVLPAIVLAPRGKRVERETWDEFVTRMRPVLIATGIAFAVIGGYVLFGAMIDWPRFKLFLKIQGASRLGRFDVATFFLETIPLNWKNQQVTVFAGGWVWLWLTAVWASRRRVALFPIVAFVYLAALVAAVDGRWLYGWYELPLFAPLCACAGAFLVALLRRPTMPAGLALLLLGVLPFGGGLERPGLLAIADPEKMRVLRYLVVLGAAPLGLDLAVRTGWSRNLARGCVAVLAIAFLLACVSTSWQIDRFYAAAAIGQ